MATEFKICTRCIMDTTDPEIQFDSDGVCNHCSSATQRLNQQLLPSPQREQELESIVNRIKDSAKKKNYDCIIGVSGGVDSMYVLYQVVKLGLRPLAVHFDNGWNSELAVDNIHKILQSLNVDLKTYVVDWEEFKDLQLSFLKSSMPNAEAPTDHGITATLYHTTHDEGLKYIIYGGNLASEAILPISWSYYSHDLRLLKSVHQKFGHIPLKTMPTISILQYFYYVFIRGMRQIPLLNYMDYDKVKAKEFLIKEFGWKDYGGKHYESVWTRFFQGFYLPSKFNFDKRKAHLSSLIVSGQMTRESALHEIEKPAYDPDLFKQDLDFVMKKFDLTKQEFQNLIDAPKKKVTDYQSNYFLFHKMNKYKNVFRKIATQA